MHSLKHPIALRGYVQRGSIDASVSEEDNLSTLLQCHSHDVSHLDDIIETLSRNSFLCFDAATYGCECRGGSASFFRWSLLSYSAILHRLSWSYFGLRQVCKPSRSNLTGKAFPPRCSTSFSTWTRLPGSQYRKRNPPPPAPRSLPPIAPFRRAAWSSLSISLLDIAESSAFFVSHSEFSSPANSVRLPVRRESFIWSVSSFIRSSASMTFNSLFSYDSICL